MQVSMVCFYDHLAGKKEPEVEAEAEVISE